MKKLNILIFLCGILPLGILKQLKLENKLNLIFFSLIFLVYNGVFIFRIIKDRIFLEELNIIKDYIDEKRDILKKDTEGLNDIFKVSNKDLNDTWKEYSKNLIQDIDGEYHEGTDISMYFNSESLIYRRVNTKLFNYISQSFVALGIIGTFLGLAIGLGSLGSGNVFTQSEEIVSQKMNILLNGVTTSFYTSLYGLYYSVIYSVFFSIYMGLYQNKASRFVDSIKFCFSGNIISKSIDNIKDGINKIDLRYEQMYTSIVDKFEESIKTITEMNSKSHEYLNKEFSEKIEKIQLSIINSNESLTEKNFSLLESIDEKMEKMASSIENKTINLIAEIENRQKLIIENTRLDIEKMRDTNVEISNLVESGLEKTISIFTKNHEKFLKEFDELKIVFRKSLSEDFGKIFEGEFLDKIGIIKVDLLKSIENTQKILTSNSELYEKSSVQNKKSLQVTEKINERLTETFEKIYSEDYLNKIVHIKAELAEISEKNRDGIHNFVKDISKVNSEIKDNNIVYLEFNNKLKESLEIITDKNYINEIEISRKNFVDVNKLTTEILEKSFSKIGELTNTIENMDLHFEKSFSTLKDALDLIEEKVLTLKTLNSSNENSLELTQDIQKQINKMLRKIEKGV
ncbi:MAG: hypothetical protein ACRC0F_00810 [Cetobacterium sp.]